LVLHIFLPWTRKTLIKLFLTQITTGDKNTHKLVSEKIIKFVSVIQDSRKSTGFFRKKEKDISAFISDVIMFLEQ